MDGQKFNGRKLFVRKKQANKNEDVDEEAEVTVKETNQKNKVVEKKLIKKKNENKFRTPKPKTKVYKKNF